MSRSSSTRTTAGAPTPPPPGDERADAAALFAGPGEMRALCRAHDWAATPLGPVAGWTRALRTVVRTVLASRHPMFLFWGPELVQFYNDAYRPSFGASGRHPAALGMRGRECWTDIWDIIGPQVEQVMRGGPATWHEDQLVPIERNGRIEEAYWTYSYGPVPEDDGEVAGTLVVCQETTTRVIDSRRMRGLAAGLSAERGRLEGLLESAPAVMAIFSGPDHVISYVNPTWNRVVGKPGAVGQPFRDVFPEMAETGLYDRLDEVYATGEGYAQEELQLPLRRRPGGPVEETYWSFVLQPLTGAAYEQGARFGGASGLGRDVLVHAIEITTQVRARREVDVARHVAEAANRAKGDFLAVMSHELRTPLNAIAGYAELMELGLHGPVTPEQQHALRRIQHSQRHLLGLVNGVLNYARVESGNVHYHLADVPLDETLATCEALIAPQAHARRLRLAYGGADAALTVCADRDKLQQVVLNLLSNAVKFTDVGGEVELTAAVDGGAVLVRVRDTGLGIAPEQLERIFEPFVQVDARLTRTAEGVGLGLAISRDLARGMGGDLTVESTPGVGSAFTLRLPRAGAA